MMNRRVQTPKGGELGLIVPPMKAFEHSKGASNSAVLRSNVADLSQGGNRYMAGNLGSVLSPHLSPYQCFSELAG